MSRHDGYLQAFVRDAADRGCRVNHSGGGTCIDRQDSARAARAGRQPEIGPRWGESGDTGVWRDRIAAGEGMCRGCRARRVLEGSYYAPSSREFCA